MENIVSMYPEREYANYKCVCVCLCMHIDVPDGHVCLPVVRVYV